MYRTQIAQLNELGSAMMQKALACTQAKDVQIFTSLGLQALQEAREIAEGLKSNSVLLWLECTTLMRKKASDYSLYVDFCARNGLEAMSTEDYTNIIEGFYIT